MAAFPLMLPFIVFKNLAAPVTIRLPTLSSVIFAVSISATPRVALADTTFVVVNVPVDGLKIKLEYFLAPSVRVVLSAVPENNTS